MAMTSLRSGNYCAMYRKQNLIRNCKTLINRWMSTLGGDIPRARVKIDERVEEELSNKETIRIHPGMAKMISSVVIPTHWTETATTVFPENDPRSSAELGQKLYDYLSKRQLPVEEEYLKEKARQLEIECLEKKRITKKENQTVEQVENAVKDWVKKKLTKMTYNWISVNYTEIRSLAYLYGRSSADYASLLKIFNEIQKRLPEYQPNSILDFGSGTGTVLWAAHDLWKKDFQEYYAVDISSHMNNLSQTIANQKGPGKKAIVKSTTYRQFLPATNERLFDVVVSAFTLFEMPNLKSRLQAIENLWAKTKDFLIIVETGTYCGYQLIAEARDFILKTSEVEAQAFAPCPHNLTCPRLVDTTPCNFEVKYVPMFQIRDMTPTVERYSYVVLQKGKKYENNWPRIVRPVLRRGGHTICRLCTEHGELKEVVVTASKHGKMLHKCAKISEWGDRLPTVEDLTPDDTPKVPRKKKNKSPKSNDEIEN